MAIKKKVKKEKVNTTRGDTFAIPAPPSMPHASVEMKKAQNGYIVTTYCSKKGEICYIESTEKKAKERAASLLKL